MPVLLDWNLAISADKVLWGQGADPAIIRTRNPRLADIAHAVIGEGSKYLRPAVAYERYFVKELRHERLLLDGDDSNGRRQGWLAGPLVAQHLSAAEHVVISICTVGDELRSHASELLRAKPLLGVALDALASAAVETLAEAMCRRLEMEAAANGMIASMPLHPGMLGWPTLEGQEQVFSLVNGADIGVRLSKSGLMEPLKSVSFVVGVGREQLAAGTSCDSCAMHGLCTYAQRNA